MTFFLENNVSPLLKHCSMLIKRNPFDVLLRVHVVIFFPGTQRPRQGQRQLKNAFIFNL